MIYLHIISHTILVAWARAGKIVIKFPWKYNIQESTKQGILREGSCEKTFPVEKVVLAVQHWIFN